MQFWHTQLTKLLVCVKLWWRAAVYPPSFSQLNTSFHCFCSGLRGSRKVIRLMALGLTQGAQTRRRGAGFWGPAARHGKEEKEELLKFIWGVATNQANQPTHWFVGHGWSINQEWSISNVCQSITNHWISLIDCFVYTYYLPTVHDWQRRQPSKEPTFRPCFMYSDIRSPGKNSTLWYCAVATHWSVAISPFRIHMQDLVISNRITLLRSNSLKPQNLATSLF